MKLSIVVPSYNTEELLQDCLRSIIRETKGINYEIIVVDNGSKYKIKNQISRLRQACLPARQGYGGQAKICLIQNSVNLGFAKACNQGIKQAKGDNLLFLNSDTVILDRAINKAVNLLENNKNIDILGCQLLNQDKTIQPSAGYFPKLRQMFYMMFFLDDLPILNKLLKPYHQQDKNFYQKKQEVDWVTGAFLLIKKAVINKISGFDEDYFMYAEEVDFCYRAKRAGFRVFYIPEAKIIHQKEASSRQAVLGEYKGLQIFFKKHKISWELPILKLILRIGALLRVFIFGILVNDAKKREIYFKAFKLV